MICYMIIMIKKPMWAGPHVGYLNQSVPMFTRVNEMQCFFSPFSFLALFLNMHFPLPSHRLIVNTLWVLLDNSCLTSRVFIPILFERDYSEKIKQLHINNASTCLHKSGHYQLLIHTCKWTTMIFFPRLTRSLLNIHTNSINHIS